MPLRLDVKRKLSARSDRVKCVDLHPTEPWMLAALYNGNVHVWNYESQQLIKTFEVCELPVRAARFIPRKHWIVTGSDDMQLRVYNYNTLERVHQMEAHADYLRCIAVHPTQPYILTCSDDMMIKLWEWEKWSCVQVFEGHAHYVMQIVINPKDNNQFASASLDRTVKVWQLGCAQAAFTLEGHEKGVNCIDYYLGGDKPYLISGADDRIVKVWDYQNKTCVHSLEGHVQNVTAVAFHPELPLLLTGSEDGTVRVWHASTFRLETSLNYGLERVWALNCQKGSNQVAVGYDEGSVLIKMGREEPAVSMDVTGKIVWARHSEIQQANVRALTASASSQSAAAASPDSLCNGTNGEGEMRDGERLPLSVKDLGSCEIYPQSLMHNSNGRFLAVVGDGEYIIYTAMALRNKSFGQAAELAWSAGESNTYAIREAGVSSAQVKIFKNFKEQRAFKPELGAEGIFGGHLLGVRSLSGLALYDWETVELVRRIEIAPRALYWNESGELLAIITDESFFILKFNQAAVQAAQAKKATGAAPADCGWSEDGYEMALDVLHEIHEQVRTGLWIADCFAYTTALNRLNYFVGGETVTIAHLDRTMYILNYIAAENRLYLSDKELGVVSYRVLRSVLEYQTAVMRKDLSSADRILALVPREQRTRIAHFLEKQGYLRQALAVTTETEHKLELAVKLGELSVSHRLLVEAANEAARTPDAQSSITDIEHKWKTLAELAVRKCEFPLAAEALQAAQDEPALLLLATSLGDRRLVESIAERALADKHANTAFLAYFTLSNLEKCLDILITTERLPEAAFFARTYLPSQISRVVKLWRTSLSQVNAKAAQSLADPTEYENLFTGLKDMFKAEQFLAEGERKQVNAASDYPTLPKLQDRKPVEEMQSAERSGAFVYRPQAPTVLGATVAGSTSEVEKSPRSGDEGAGHGGRARKSSKPEEDSEPFLDADASNTSTTTPKPSLSPGGKPAELLDLDEGPRTKEKKSGHHLHEREKEKEKEIKTPVRPSAPSPPLSLTPFAASSKVGASASVSKASAPSPTPALSTKKLIEEEDEELDLEQEVERELAKASRSKAAGLGAGLGASFGSLRAVECAAAAVTVRPPPSWDEDEDEEEEEQEQEPARPLPAHIRPAPSASSRPLATGKPAPASAPKPPPSFSAHKDDDDEEVDLDD